MTQFTGFKHKSLGRAFTQQDVDRINECDKEFTDGLPFKVDSSEPYAKLDDDGCIVIKSKLVTEIADSDGITALCNFATDAVAELAGQARLTGDFSVAAYSEGEETNQFVIRCTETSVFAM